MRDGLPYFLTKIPANQFGLSPTNLILGKVLNVPKEISHHVKLNLRAKNVHDGMYTWPYADINAEDPVEDHKNRKIYFYRQYMTDLTERNTKIGAVYPGFKGTVRL